jgi:peptidyl-prolyl cis-trans isomerase C
MRRPGDVRKELTMTKLTRTAAALVLGSTIAATAAAQAPPGAPPAAPGNPPGAVPPPSLTPPAVTPQAQPAPPQQRPPGVAATVNGQQIPEVAVYRALRTFPPANQEAARKEILTHLIETTIVDQYLTALKVEVPPAEVEKLIGELKKELTDAKKDYNKELEAMLLTEAEFRVEVVNQMKWEQFVKQQATDQALKQMYDTNPAVFDGTLVRARHILLNPGSDPAKKNEAAGHLRGTKQAIEQEAAKAVAALPPNSDEATKAKTRAAKVDELFAAFAKRDSVCPSKRDGGDLNLFPRAGAMVEPFAKTAFDLQVWQMSDVVETEFGYHLILVTDRKPGTVQPFDKVKEDVKVLFAMRLREAVIAQQKPKSQISIMPTPGGAAGAGAPQPGGPAAGVPNKN